MPSDYYELILHSLKQQNTLVFRQYTIKQQMVQPSIPQAMQTLHGHSDIETTMQIYVDASKKIMKRATKDYEKLPNDLFESADKDGDKSSMDE